MQTIVTTRNGVTTIWGKDRARLYHAYRFFKSNAGYVVGECSKGALALARAEEWAEEEDLDFDWQYDDDPEYCACGCDRDIPQYYASIRNQAGEHLYGVGNIGDPSRETRRVIEAELALVAMAGGITLDLDEPDA